MEGDLLIYNIGCLATPEGFVAKSGNEQGGILLRNNCYVHIANGKIEEVGDSLPGIENKYNCERIDACGNLVTPGLVDCHTHLVFGGWRQKEMALKLSGASYLEILVAGGGILSTVEKTREASPEELYGKCLALLDESLSYGVTTMEAKSGYGLDTHNEIKSLEVIKKLNSSQPVDIAATFMGAHTVPKEHRESRDKFIASICNEMLPVIAEKKLAEYCDVFCETGAFTTEESRAILEKAKSLGFKLKIHAEEISNSGGAVLAGELGCASAEHLIKIDAAGIETLAKSGTVAVLLPCTSFYLNESFAPARNLIGSGVPVAVATDFNPGSSPNLNIQLAMNIACYRYRMSPAEVLTAVTLNAAAAIGRESVCGTLEKGKNGDIVIWDSKDLDYIFYRYGSNLVKAVVKNGKIVKGRASCQTSGGGAAYY